MNVLPQAIAKGRNQNGTMAGKLNGTIAAHTPTGWRIVSVSTAVATFSRIRPCIVWGIADAASIISIARPTSARASGKTLPDAMEMLVEYYRSTSGEHPDWDDYRAAMEREQRVLIRLTVTRAGPNRQGSPTVGTHVRRRRDRDPVAAPRIVSGA